MVIAADYPFLDIFWTMLVFFGWIIWLVLLIRVIGDVFRSDTSGFGKAAWLVFVIVLPFLGVLIYLIVHGDDMGKRDVAEAQAARASFDDYVRSVASAEGPAAEIAKAKELLDSGAITQAEFEAIKAKAVA
jgi:phospholipase D-like protein/putative oligomerization/nucleic acid binding protein